MRSKMRFVVAGRDPFTEIIEDWVAIVPSSRRAEELCRQLADENPDLEYTFFTLFEEMEKEG